MGRVGQSKGKLSRKKNGGYCAPFFQFGLPYAIRSNLITFLSTFWFGRAVASGVL